MILLSPRGDFLFMERGAIHTLEALKNPTVFGWTPLEGKLNTANSPKFFPDLDLTGRRFLRGVATALHLSRISLLLSERLRGNYISTNIRILTDVADGLVLTNSADPLLFPPKYDFRSLRLFTRYRYHVLNEIAPNGIAAVEMHFAPKDGPGGDKEVSLHLQPNPLRTYSARGYDYLNGLTRDGARRDLSLKRVAPDKAVEVIDTYSETPMALTIRSHRANGSGAELRIIFAGEGMGNTNIDQVICRLSVIEGALTKGLIQVHLPVSDFSEEAIFSSQDTLEKWLSKIALNLAVRAKPSQKVRVSPDQRTPSQKTILV